MDIWKRIVWEREELLPHLIDEGVLSMEEMTEEDYIGHAMAEDEYIERCTREAHSPTVKQDNQTIWFSRSRWHEGATIYSIHEREGHIYGAVDWNGVNYVVRFESNDDWPVWIVTG